MGCRRAESLVFNRREFLRHLGFATSSVVPVLLPAPLRALAGPIVGSRAGLGYAVGEEALADFRLTPAYPSRSPLDELLRLAAPGTDAYVTEKFAAELQGWFEAVRRLLT